MTASRQMEEQYPARRIAIVALNRFLAGPAERRPKETRELQELLAFWSLIGDTGRLPMRSDFEPQELQFILPHVFMLDVQGDGSFRYRLVGSELVEKIGFDPTGGRIDAAETRDAILGSAGLIRQMVQRQQVMLARGGSERTISAHERFLAAAMPLANSSGDVSIVLGAAFLFASAPANGDAVIRYQFI